MLYEVITVLFRIDQEANVPYVTLPDGTSGLMVQSAGGECQVKVIANVPWTYTIDDDSWLEELDVTDTEIRFHAAKNTDETRSATVTVKAVEFPGVEETILSYNFV